MNLDDLEALLAAATPGPWTDYSEEGPDHLGPAGYIHSLCHSVAPKISDDDDDKHVCVAYLRGADRERAAVNAEAIAALRNMAPALLRVAKAARALAKAPLVWGAVVEEAELIAAVEALEVDDG